MIILRIGHYFQNHHLFLINIKNLKKYGANFTILMLNKTPQMVTIS